MISRRRFLRSSATAAVSAEGVAIMAMPTEAAAPDPMAVLIREYQRLWAEHMDTDANRVFMNSLPGSLEFRAAEAVLDILADRTWRPIYDRLQAGKDLPPVTTIEGAAECVAFVLQQTDGCEMEDKDRHILRAVVAFLEGRAS